MENEVQLEGVDWTIIEGGFYDPDPAKIKGSEKICEACKQLIQVPKRTLKEELLKEFAEKVANVSKAKGLKMNQLRNFYDVIKTTQNKLMQAHTLEQRKNDFDFERRRLKLLFSKVVHAQQRGKIPDVFVKFMNECLEIVTDEKAEYDDFEAFVLTFEAVTGYFGKDK